MSSLIAWKFRTKPPCIASPKSPTPVIATPVRDFWIGYTTSSIGATFPKVKFKWLTEPFLRSGYLSLHAQVLHASAT